MRILLHCYWYRERGWGWGKLSMSLLQYNLGYLLLHMYMKRTFCHVADRFIFECLLFYIAGVFWHFTFYRDLLLLFFFFVTCIRFAAGISIKIIIINLKKWLYQNFSVFKYKLTRFYSVLFLCGDLNFWRTFFEFQEYNYDIVKSYLVKFIFSSPLLLLWYISGENK